LNEKNEYVPERNPLLIVISGPAGVGKDSVIRCLERTGEPLHFVVTATDRAPRPGEIHGKDYYFVSTEEFEHMIRDDELLEHAVVYEQYKGIPKRHIRAAMDSGKDAITRVDVQGARTIRDIAPDALLIFLAASEEDLIKRLRRRGSDSPEQLAVRMEQYHREMEYIDIFDYVVFNHEDELGEAVEDVLAIITAERCRVHQREVTL
jgi:guanylate kinase